MSRVRPQTLLYEEQPAYPSVGAMQVHALVQKLQVIAKNAGHERPLMIGIDQENGPSIRKDLGRPAKRYLP